MSTEGPPRAHCRRRPGTLDARALSAPPRAGIGIAVCGARKNQGNERCAPSRPNGGSAGRSVKLRQKYIPAGLDQPRNLNWRGMPRWGISPSR